MSIAAIILGMKKNLKKQNKYVVWTHSKQSKWYLMKGDEYYTFKTLRSAEAFYNKAKNSEDFGAVEKPRLL